MSRQISKQQFNKLLELCKKGKHKLRENKFGVVFCTHCGLLSTSVGNAKPLSETNSIIISEKSETECETIIL